MNIYNDYWNPPAVCWGERLTAICRWVASIGDGLSPAETQAGVSGPALGVAGEGGRYVLGTAVPPPRRTAITRCATGR